MAKKSTKKNRKSVGRTKSMGRTAGRSSPSVAQAIADAASKIASRVGQILVKEYTRKPPPWAKKKEPIRVRAYERKVPRWLHELWCRKYPEEARKRGLTCPPPLTGATTNDLGEAFMARELVELGKEKVIKKSAIKAAKTPEACEAAGGIWRSRGGRVWMKEEGECMTPPSWLIDLWRRKGIEVTVMEGLCEMGDPHACTLCGLEDSGLGYFITPGESCPPGYVKVKTKHPLWKKGEFYMCVHPEAVPRLRAQGLVGSSLGAFFPEAPRPESVLYGVLAGSFASTFGKTLLPRIITTIKPASPYINYGISAALAVTHLLVGTDFTFGMFLGALGPTIETLAEQIAGLLAPAPAPAAPAPAPAVTPEVGPGGVGQTREELERLRKKLQFAFPPTGGSTRVVGSNDKNVGYVPEPAKDRLYVY